MPHASLDPKFLPNQINLPSKQTTLRWVFQLMEEVNLVKITLNGISNRLIDGLCAFKSKIIGLLGEKVRIFTCDQSLWRLHQLNM